MLSTEQVSKYHPDKYADQISDAILTEALRQDEKSRVACETLVKDTTVVIAGEITTQAKLDYEKIVRQVAAKLNYQVDKVINLISQQSVEIAAGVDVGGAGDQGMMFGYATSETPSKLPFAFALANQIIQVLEDDLKNNRQSILRGDAKCQITVAADQKTIDTILISACHLEGLSLAEVRNYLENLLPEKVKNVKQILLNPAGLWTVGGPASDCGVTGRKIVCDQYGGFCPVGGGAFSGKDPTKVDRSGAYMARYLAVEMVKKYQISEVLVQLAYAIGMREPVSVDVKIKTSENLTEKEKPEQELMMTKWIKENHDLTPQGIIKTLGLLKIDYARLAEGCHYRREFEKVK